MPEGKLSASDVLTIAASDPRPWLDAVRDRVTALASRRTDPDRATKLGLAVDKKGNREADVRDHKAIKVVYGINRSYLVPAAVSIHSMCERATAPLEIVVYGDGLGSSDHQTLRRVGEVSGAAIDIRRYDPSGVGDFKWNFHARWPAILALRLELPWLAAGRCLFIDADTLVVGDVSEIMSIDLQGMPLGACMDPAIDGSWNLAKPRRRLIQRRFSDALLPKRSRRLRESELYRAVRMGLRPGDVYFNAGVLVMECDAIRALAPPIFGAHHSMTFAAWNLIMSTFWTRIGLTSSSLVATAGCLCVGISIRRRDLRIGQKAPVMNSTARCRIRASGILWDTKSRGAGHSNHS